MNRKPIVLMNLISYHSLSPQYRADCFTTNQKAKQSHFRTKCHPTLQTKEEN
uniref:Uncharacterized protein n=1 Tax=Anguilla anguilla TaxID=7936 RepID=A0A0E9W9R4_ANGAN